MNSSKTTIGLVVLIMARMFHCGLIPTKIAEFRPEREFHGNQAVASSFKMRAMASLSNPLRFLYNQFRPAIKLVGVLYLGFQLANYFMPTISGAFGSKSRDSALSLSDAIGELGVSAMMENMRDWNTDLSKKTVPTEVLNTWEKQCKSRATCELGRSLAFRMPYLSKVVGYFGSKLPFVGNFPEALMTGTDSPDCSEMYPDCPYTRPTNDEL